MHATESARLVCRHWPGNQDVDKVLQILKPIKDKYPNLSWADLIVLSGTAAVEAAAGDTYKFCGGRTDATTAGHIEQLAPRNYTTVAIKVSEMQGGAGLGLVPSYTDAMLLLLAG